MKIMQTRVGDVQTNCYLVFDENTHAGAIIDPGDNAQHLLQMIKDNGVELQYILLTHAHFDHIMAVGAIQHETGAKVVVNPKDSYLYKQDAGLNAFGAFGRQMRERYEFPPVDIEAGEGTEVTFGDITAHYYSTPGHTPGSCVIQMGNCLFTGDTLFRHECGRCDLAGGDFGEMLKSLKRLHDFEGDFHVLPGHEGTSTLEEERQHNPYMRQACGA